MSAPTPEGEARPASSPRGGRGLGHVALALGLTFAAGMVDATGFLAFGGVFVSFMSGDTTRLGVALAQGAWPTGVLFASTIALFVVGAAIGHALAATAGRWRRAAVLTLTALLLVMAAAAGRLAMGSAALILTAPAMGMLNTAIAHAEGVAVTPAYITGTLVRLGHGVADWALGRGGGAVAVLLPMWLAMLAGAGVGGSAYARWGLTTLAAPAGLMAVLAILAAAATALRSSRSES